ncbi:MAG: DUF2974 domain-containing protein [Candidatus Gastranaerophilales bacterium]|nr:DUF2974 domain-containing protein [Candidatus Gastranaerophilales bacterium]
MQIQNNSISNRALIGIGATTAGVGAIGAYKFINKKDTFEKIPISDVATIKKHETIAKLAQDCSEHDGLGKIDGFNSIKKIENAKTGFAASVYKNDFTDEIVISYRATKNQAGVENVLQMMEEKIPSQFQDAQKLYKQIQKEFPTQKITVSGHSLGGSLAQLVAAKNPNVKAITFDSFGTSSIIKANKKSFLENASCINYRTNGSFISALRQHPGKTMSIKKICKEGSKHDIINFIDLQGAQCVKKAKGFSIKRFFSDIIASHSKFFLEKLPILKKKLPKMFFKGIR